MADGAQIWHALIAAALVKARSSALSARRQTEASEEAESAMKPRTYLHQATVSKHLGGIDAAKTTLKVKWREAAHENRRK